MKIHFLLDQNIQNEINLIKTSIDNKENCVFLYMGKERLNEYIDSLSDKKKDGLDNEYLYKLKICYEREGLSLELYKWLATTNTGLPHRYAPRNDDLAETNVEAQTKQSSNLSNSNLLSLNNAGLPRRFAPRNDVSGNKKSISSISELVRELEPDYSYFIIVKNNDLEQLTFIMQQIIYIGFPQEKIEIVLQKEVDTVSKTNNLIKDSSKLISNCKNVIIKLNNSKISKNDKKIWEKIKSSIEDIESIATGLERLSDSNVKIGVVATKKAGKSVFTNCLLEENISPSSVQLPTPNIIQYQKSLDKKYHSKISTKDLSFEKCEDLNEYIKKQFDEAANNKWSLEDMVVEYASSPKYIKPNVILYDTPGPNAANADDHKEKAYKVIEKLDVAIFIIDYGKYLTSDEAEYFIDIVNKFSSNEKYRSLIILVNKVDLRFNDAKVPHSVIGFLDFLKSRIGSKPFQELLNIEKEKIRNEKYYKKILLFPVCSLEYLNTVITEKANIEELNNLKGVTFDGLIELKKKCNNIEELHWLTKYAINLEDLGENSFSFNTFKQDSGIPNLMEYVSKVINIYSSKIDLISELRSKIREIEDNNLSEEINKINNNKIDLINEKNNLIIKKNNLNNNISNINEKIETLKEICNNSFCEELKKFSKLASNYGYIIERCDNYYYNSVQNYIYRDDIDITVELYERFFYFIWSNLNNWKNGKVDINGKKINSLLEKYNISSDAYNIFRVKVDSLKEKIADDFNKLKLEFFEQLNNDKNELKSFSEYFKSEFIKYDIDFELKELFIEDIGFTNTYDTNIYFNQNLTNINLYEKIKVAFERTYGAVMYKIVTFGFADEMEAGLNLTADYNAFRKIFDENVKSEYCAILSGFIVCRMFNEIDSIVKERFIDANFKKLIEAVNVINDYSITLNNSFEILKKDVDKKMSQYNGQIKEYNNQINEITKEINKKDKKIEDCKNGLKAIADLQKILSDFSVEFKTYDKIIETPVNQELSELWHSIVDESTSNKKEENISYSQVANTNKPIINKTYLEEENNLYADKDSENNSRKEYLKKIEYIDDKKKSVLIFIILFILTIILFAYIN